VVDNDSNDNSQQILCDKYGDEVIYIGLPDNVGFGRANNEGIKIAQGKNILFLNPDTLLINNAVKILSDYLDNNEKVAICGGNLFDEENQPAFSFTCMYPSLLLIVSDVVKFLPSLLFGRSNRFNYTNEAKKVKDIIGADLMIKREICNRVNGFDPRYFMYIEETDLCYRVSKLGYDIISVPSAKIQHLIGKSFSESKEDINVKKIKMVAQSKNLFYQLHYSPSYIMFAKYLTLILIKLRIISFKYQNEKKYIKWKTMYDIYKTEFKSQIS
jgi:GT2 family glycosyltransferase